MIYAILKLLISAAGIPQKSFMLFFVTLPLKITTGNVVIFASFAAFICHDHLTHFFLDRIQNIGGSPGILCFGTLHVKNGMHVLFIL